MAGTETIPALPINIKRTRNVLLNYSENADVSDGLVPVNLKKVHKYEIGVTSYADVDPTKRPLNNTIPVDILKTTGNPGAPGDPNGLEVRVNNL